MSGFFFPELLGSSGVEDGSACTVVRPCGRVSASWEGYRSLCRPYNPLRAAKCLEAPVPVSPTSGAVPGILWLRA